MSLSVDFSKWRVKPGIGELSRTYYFSGLHAPDPTATLKLDCRLKRSVGGFINSIFTLYVRPFRLLHETPLVMGLVTTDQSKGGIVQVRAYPVEGDRDTALLAVEGTQDVQDFLSAISSGKELFFMLGDQTRPFVKFPLPNDGEFRRLYNETYARMARAQDASSDGFYLKHFSRGVDALLDAVTTKQRSLTAVFKNGSRQLAKTARDTFTHLKAATVGLTRRYPFRNKVDVMAERLRARTKAPAVAGTQYTENGLYLKRPLRSVDGLLDAATARQRSFATAFKQGKRRLAKTALDTFTGLKAATVGLKNSFLNKIYIAERLRARREARAVARTQYANRDGQYFRRFLSDLDGLLDAATARKRSFATAFKEGRRRLAETAVDTFTRLTNAIVGPTWRYSFAEKISAMVEWLNPRAWKRDWVVFGLSLIPGIVIIVLLVGPPNNQSTSNSPPPSNSGASPAGPAQATAVSAQAAAVPAQATANVTTQAETVNYVGSLADATNKEPLKLRQTSAPAEIHQVTHAIGEVGTLKQAFIGCRESWENDGLLKLESKAFGNECDVRLPAGTEVIVANIRANNNICLRFPDGIVCYWATGDVLKSPKLLPATPTEVHPIKARQAKARPAIRRGEEDDGLSFLR
jgi:hypothetical protein